MKPIKQEQRDILEMIQAGRISAEDGYNRLLELKREQLSDKEELRTIPLELSLATHPSSANHILFDQKVMSMDGFIELICGALFREGNISRISLTKIAAMEALREPVGSHSIKKLVVEYRKSNRSFVLRDAEGVSPKVYLKGNISESISKPATIGSGMDFADENAEHLTDEMIYSLDAHTHIGDFYRNIFDFSFSGDQAVFRFSPQGKGNLSLDPTLLNSVILGGIKLAQQQYPQQEGFYIPVELDGLDMDREAVTKFELDVRGPLQVFVGISHADGNYVTLDAAIIRDDGDVVLQCSGLRLKWISLAQPEIEAATTVSVNSDNPNNYDREIAIIGMAGRFPEADDCEQFWQLLSEGRSAIKEVPKNRWNIDDVYSGNPGEYRKTYCRYGGFLSDIDQFDARFFQMTDKEAELTDPQQRLFLEACWEAMEEAGYANDVVSRTACGVFVGVGQSDYQDRMKSEEIQVGPQSFWGNDNSVLAARISYYLNLKGPSIAINTACSSSLVSIHLACQSILSGECNMALAGGVYIGTTPNFFIVSSNAQMLSPDGTCYAFDHRANGFVPGEGVGAIVLKSMKQAIKDKDPIIGVINASALNQDGKTNGITAPSSLSQSELEEKLYRQAGINPASISYVEAHGTGTPLGDPIEFEALSRSFRKFTSKEQFCALGSVKANIGHAATAAGIASMIKVLLALRHKQIPPCITFEQENPNIHLNDSPFFINKALIPWVGSKEAGLRAAVSSFGFSGTNCHIVVSEPPRSSRKKTRDNRLYFIPLSARTSDSLKAQMIRLSRRLMEGTHLELSDIAYTLSCRRKHFPIRTAFIARTLNDLLEQLQAAIVDLSAHEARTVLPVVSSDRIVLLSEIADCKDKWNQWYFQRLQEVARLYKDGAELEWSHLYRDEEVQCVPLPAYAFQKRCYWLDIPELELLPSSIADVVSHEHTKTSKNQTVFYTKKWMASPVRNVAINSQVPLFIVTDCANKTLISDSCKQVITVSSTDWQDQCKQLGQRVSATVQGLGHAHSERVKLAILLGEQIPWNWNNEEDYQERLAQSFYVLFQIARSLSQLKETVVDIVFVFQLAEGKSQPFFAALEGLARAIMLEQSRIAVRIVEQQEATDASLDWDTLLRVEFNDMAVSRGSAFVRYASGQRWVPSLSEVQLPALNVQHTSLRMGGTYLITGGTQGIGQAMAIYLAQAYHAKLILLGRSNIHKKIEALLDQLHHMGCDAQYTQADVTSSAEVELVADRLKTSGIRLDGIFHCAGSVSNDVMKDKQKEQIEHVLGPKVVGTMHLLRYLQPITKDFIMLFSSITSLFGGKGQTDYAYANSFMDNLSQMYHTKRPYLLSANWFHWMSGGMRPEPELLHYMQRDFGVQPITTEQGMEAIERWLQSDYLNLLILHGELPLIHQAVTSYTPSLSNQTEDNETSLDYLPTNTDVQTYNSQLVILLRRIISQETGIPPKELEQQSEFESLGMDSLMITNVTSSLEKVFPGLPKTVFFEVFTLDELALYLNEHYTVECRKLFQNTAASLTGSRDETESIESIEKPLEHEPETEEASNQRGDIAVIGMSGIYPKAPDLQAFWDRLSEGTDCIEKAPLERWDTLKNASLGYGGYLEQYDQFDPLFFRISPKEAEWMDPQERLFIQEVWHAMEDAGYTREALQGKKVGVFVGVTNGHYQLNETEIDGELVSPLNSYASIANRISYLLHLEGPSLAVDTMCSSFLTALHLASESLKRNECDMAIVGSANLIMHPYKQVQLALSKFASPKGRCHSFGKSADGYVPGEGVGAMLLKPVALAEADEDYIYGVIRATSINHGGRSNGYTVPNPKAQSMVIVDALNKAGVSPEDIGYLEAHGAGTPLGDPIEIQGLSQAFGRFTQKKQYCAIGSVKSSIGHLEAAAGLAGLTKVLLQMKHKCLVPSLHANELNPDIDFSQTPFTVHESFSPWPAVTKKLANGSIIERPRLAGISAFGAGGSNGHVIVEEYNNDKQQLFDHSTEESQLFVFSAMDAPSLRRTVYQFSGFVESTISPVVSQAVGLITERARKDVYQILSELIDVPQESIGDEHNLSDYFVGYFDWSRLLQRLSEQGYPLLKTASGLEGATIGDLIRQLEGSRKLVNDTEKVAVRLCDMAYTLQVGREALKERLALVAHSTSDLVMKLRTWLSQSDANMHPEIYCTFTDTTINVAADTPHSSNEDLHRLAQSWVEGRSVNWSTLVRKQPVRRVPLPGYSFHPERYWVKAPAKSSFIPERHQLHPLVGRNESTFDRNVFTTVFDGHEFFLNDHVLLNQKVLPGMAYLEIARYAASQATGELIYCIRDMMWSQVFKLEAGPLTMVTELSRDEKGIGCKFSSVDDENQQLVHGSCRIITGLMKARPQVSLELLQERMDGYLEGTDMYEYYRVGGLNYGPAFKMVQSVRYNANEALAKLNLPASLESSFGLFGLHPALLDAAFQGGICIQSNHELSSSNTHIPFFLEEAIMYEPLERECYAYITMTPRASSYVGEDSGIRKLNCQLLSTTGSILVELKGFTARAAQLVLPTSQLSNEEQPSILVSEEKTISSIKYYVPAWEHISLKDSFIEGGQEDLIIIFDTNGNRFENVIKEAVPTKAVLVTPGDEFQQVGQTSYTMRFDQSSDYTSLLRDLVKDGHVPTHIILGCSAPKRENTLEELLDHHDISGKLHAELKYNSIAVFHVLKAWKEVLDKKELTLLACEPLTDGLERVMSSTIRGFAHSLQLHMPWVKMKTVQMPARLMETQPRRLLSELFKAREITRVKLLPEMNNRYEMKFQPMVLTNHQASLLRMGGNYLVTGGMGGIGKIVASYLVQTCQANVILLGRSVLNEENRAFVDELQTNGCKVVYYKCDITREVELKHAQQQWNQEIGAIDGVIHAAGIMSQKDFLHKSTQDIIQVMDPKLIGTIMLDRVTQQEPLSFFLSFSSTSSILGDYGRCDYAAANNALDEYTIYREERRRQGLVSGASYVINWPIWEEGGMHLGSREAEGQMLEALGMHYLTTTDALKALETVLSQECNQVAVFAGNSSTIQQWLSPSDADSQMEVGLHEYGEPVLHESVIKDQHSNAYQEIEEKVKGIISNMLQVDTKRLDVSEKLDAYGFNSVTITELSTLMNKEFDLELNPTIFFEYSTIRSIAGYIGRLLEPEAAHMQEAVDIASLPDEVETEVDEEFTSRIYLVDQQNIRTKEALRLYLLQCSQWYQDADYRLPDQLSMIEPHKVAAPQSKQAFFHLLVEIREQKVEIMSIGKGPQLLIIPGFGISGISLIHQLAELSKYFQLLVIHLPGSGFSDGMKDLLYPPTTARTIIEVLDALSISEPIHALGFSFGGLIAQELVKQYPERFRTLTLGCSFTRTDSADTSEQSLEEKFKADFDSMRNADKYYELYLASKCVNKSAFEYLPKASLSSYSTVPEINSIEIPVLVISGRMDAVVDYHESEIIAEHVPRAVHVRFLQGGHCVNITNPSLFNQLVKLFLQENGFVASEHWLSLTDNHPIELLKDCAIEEAVISGGSDR